MCNFVRSYGFIFIYSSFGIPFSQYNSIAKPSVTSDVWSDWTEPTVSRSSRRAESSAASVVLGIVLDIAGAPKGVSSLVGVASWLVSNKQTEIYYEYRDRQRWNTANGIVEYERTTIFFEDSNYSKELGSYTKTWMGTDGMKARYV